MNNQLKDKKKRKSLLKHMILQLHQGAAQEQIKKQVKELLRKIPYNDVVEVEQELINEGLPAEEVIQLCDVHSQALKDSIDRSAEKSVSPDHPVQTFKEENKAMELVLTYIAKLFSDIETLEKNNDVTSVMVEIRDQFHSLMEVEKHYSRKENLLFPYLEKHGVTGPSTVMWGKHDEVRKLLKEANKILPDIQSLNAEEAKSVINLALNPVVQAIEEMIFKEEEILFPMSLDTLTDSEWLDIHRQSPEIGFCLINPENQRKPEKPKQKISPETKNGRINLPSGSFTVEELTTLLNTLPVDFTFVDKNDQVTFFSEGQERIFTRSRAVIGRKVQNCHPPKSLHMVEKILADFKSGKADRAPFWINLKGKFLHIEYFAIRNDKGEYMGTLEVSQDLTKKRQLKGEQRLLNVEEE